MKITIISLSNHMRTDVLLESRLLSSYLMKPGKIFVSLPSVSKNYSYFTKRKTQNKRGMFKNKTFIDYQ